MCTNYEIMKAIILVFQWNLIAIAAEPDLPRAVNKSSESARRDKALNLFPPQNSAADRGISLRGLNSASARVGEGSEDRPIDISGTKPD